MGDFVRSHIDGGKLSVLVYVSRTMGRSLSVKLMLSK